MDAPSRSPLAKATAAQRDWSRKAAAAAQHKSDGCQGRRRDTVAAVRQRLTKTGGFVERQRDLRLLSTIRALQG